jgi:Flp pilus assembly pilin Flp
MNRSIKSNGTALVKQSNRTRPTIFGKLFRDERGATFVEYIVLVALVALGGIVAWKAFGTSIKTATGAQGAEIESQAVPGL